MLLDTERSDQTGICSNTAKLRPWPCITPYVPLQIPKPMGCIPQTETDENPQNIRGSSFTSAIINTVDICPYMEGPLGAGSC